MRYLYALEHIPTGRMLPRPPSGQKGGTWAEPIDPGQHLPRFFHRERDAKGFLTTWLKGPVSVKEYQTFEGDHDVEWTVAPHMAAEARIRAHWRVVKIEWRIVA